MVMSAQMREALRNAARARGKGSGSAMVECLRHYRYPTREAADRVLYRLREELPRAPGGLVVYRCRWDPRHFHIGRVQW
jgi:hypothetical protein